MDITLMMQGTNVDPLSLDVAAANEQASVPNQRFPRTCSVSWSVVRNFRTFVIFHAMAVQGASLAFR